MGKSTISMAIFHSFLLVITRGISLGNERFTKPVEAAEAAPARSLGPGHSGIVKARCPLDLDLESKKKGFCD